MSVGAEKTYFITGATSGIGEATATELARLGHRVLIGARSAEHGEQALERIRGRVPDAVVDTVVGDLSEMRLARNVGLAVGEKAARVDGLVLNAAVSRPRHELTPEGIEVNFATNHLAGFLLTALLMPLLEQSPQGRVVAMTSSFHAHVKSLDVGGLASGTGIEPSKRYETTKLLNVLFVTELARRLRGTTVTANVADPGFVRTNLGRYTTGPFGLMLKLTRPMQDPAEKASGVVVRLATAPELAGTSGGYFPARGSTTASPLSQDPQVARTLWDYSVRLLLDLDALAPGEAL